jgi:hypothetical protein
VRSAPLPLRWLRAEDQAAYDAHAVALHAAPWAAAGELPAPVPATGQRVPPAAPASMTGLPSWSRVEVRAAAMGGDGAWGPYGEPATALTLPVLAGAPYVAGLGAEWAAVAWAPPAGAQLLYRVAVWAQAANGSWARGPDSAKAGPPADRHNVTGLMKVRRI